MNWRYNLRNDEKWYISDTEDKADVQVEEV